MDSYKFQSFYYRPETPMERIEFENWKSRQEDRSPTFINIYDGNKSWIEPVVAKSHDGGWVMTSGGHQLIGGGIGTCYYDPIDVKKSGFGG